VNERLPFRLVAIKGQVAQPDERTQRAESRKSPHVLHSHGKMMIRLRFQIASGGFCAASTAVTASDATPVI
jgi:hypothetical protein